jgi:hypothetical protein
MKKLIFVLFAALTLFAGCFLFDEVEDENANKPDNNDNNKASANAIQLTADIWADGNITSIDKEQWFKFTATASTQYVHVDCGTTLSYLYVQLYKSNGSKVGDKMGDKTELSWSKKNVYGSSFTSGSVYYIQITQSSSSTGNYKIAFSTSSTAPKSIKLPSNAIQLTVDTWADGNIPRNGEQWFKFTATADKQFIHVSFGTLNDLYVQLYNSNNGYGEPLGNETELRYDKYTSKELTAGKEYYIKVTPYSSSYNGTYKIAFNALPISTGTVITQLAFDTWENGNIPTSGGEQWFKFTATADTQFIHADFNTLRDIYVRLYKNGDPLGERTELSNSVLDPKSTKQTLITGQEYYIKVTPYSSSQSGTYKIAFNEQIIPPDTVPRELAFNAWTNGAYPLAEEWFTFTATSTTQFIHMSFNSTTPSYGLNAQLYDNIGNTVGSNAYLSNGSNPMSQYISRSSLAVGQVYYINVKPYYSETITYKIAFNESSTPPSP